MATVCKLLVSCSVVHTDRNWQSCRWTGRTRCCLFWCIICSNSQLSFPRQSILRFEAIQESLRPHCRACSSCRTCRISNLRCTAMEQTSSLVTPSNLELFRLKSLFESGLNQKSSHFRNTFLGMRKGIARDISICPEFKCQRYFCYFLVGHFSLRKALGRTRTLHEEKISSDRFTSSNIMIKHRLCLSRAVGESLSLLFLRRESELSTITTMTTTNVGFVYENQPKKEG